MEKRLVRQGLVRHLASLQISEVLSCLTTNSIFCWLFEGKLMVIPHQIEEDIVQNMPCPSLGPLKEFLS